MYVDVPEPGDSFDAGDSFGSVESVKAASDVYTPVSGEVVEVNEGLADSPANVNSSPLGEGWFMKIKLNDQGKADFEALMDDAAYKTHCDEEEH